MSTPHPFGVARVRALRAAAARFGGDHSAAKAALLADLARRAPTDVAALVEYHDCLLFLCAYPESRALRDAAGAELARMADAARAIATSGLARARAQLKGTGIAWSSITVNFGYDIAHWLAHRHRDHADLDSFGDTGARLPAVLQHALPAMEFELAAEEGADALAFLDAASEGRRGSRLRWLVDALDRLPCAPGLREHLFESLQPFTTIEPRDSALSGTFLRGLPGPVHFHREPLLRDVDVATIVAQPLPPAAPLSLAQRRQVIDAARGTLAMLGRETDAIALAEPRGVAWHALGRGAAIALFAMRADRRGPLDSHIGMMLFKNGLPVGYGGGWPFLGTCKIGVNIFAPYRGGESAWLFAQVMRVYRQRFRPERFIAEPSQIGYRNPEGLKSGAFWFYYRLGFRPAAGHLARIAADEALRMHADPRYRTPLATLRRFSRSDLELPLESPDWRGDREPPFDTAPLSRAVTGWIARRHRGDRAAAETAAIRTVARALRIGRAAGWTADQRHALRMLAPLLAQIPGLAGWPAGDRRDLVALIRAKGGDEFRFHARLARHRRLAAALATLAASA